MKLLPLLCIVCLFPFSLYAFQDCKLKINFDPVSASISANKITLGQGDEIAENSISINGISVNNNILTLDTVNNSNLNLQLSQSTVKKKVWQCDFTKKVNKQNIVVNYTLVASNGQSGGISNGNAFIPTTVQTQRLRFRNRRKSVLGDIKLVFDLSHVQAKTSGNYGGVLNIEVYEN